MTSMCRAESASGNVEFQERARGKHFVMTFIQLCMTCVANGFCASLAKISERILKVDELITVNGQARALLSILLESTVQSLPFSLYQGYNHIVEGGNENEKASLNQFNQYSYFTPSGSGSITMLTFSFDSLSLVNRCFIRATRYLEKND